MSAALAVRRVVAEGIILTTFFALAACSHAVDDSTAQEQSAEAVASSEEACGGLGWPDCPLQAWMKANMTPLVLAGDAARLRPAFVRAAELGPPAYDRWRKIALSGAEAASTGDFDAARRACKQCHDEYRPQYRRELRRRSLPPESRASQLAP